MKRLIVLFSALLAVSALPSCAHLPPPIKDFGVCVEGELAPQVLAIITEVESALASANYVALLTNLGKRVGFAAVDCAAHEVFEKAHVQYMASRNDQLASDKLERGAHWLSRQE